jgi:hypothetical protein
MRTIMLKFEEVTRRRRPMQAIQVSVDNAQEIADWCGGEMVMSTIRMMGSETKLPAVRLNRPSTGGKDYTTALVTMWIVEFPDRYQVFKNDQYEKLFEPAFPDKRSAIGTLDCPLMIVPGDAVSHHLGYDLVLPSGVITQVGFSGEGAPADEKNQYSYLTEVTLDKLIPVTHTDSGKLKAVAASAAAYHTVNMAALGHFEHHTEEKGKHALEIDPFKEPPNPTPAGESLVFKLNDRVQVIDKDSEWFEWDGTVMIGNTEDSTAVGVGFMDDVQAYRGFHPTQLKLLVREDKGEVVDEKPENTLIEWRCSKCDQIGGDSENGPYDGCPEGGKHNTDGGVV